MKTLSRKAKVELDRKYGIIPDPRVLWQAQDGRCAICRRPPGPKRLAVDHCHKSAQSAIAYLLG